MENIVLYICVTVRFLKISTCIYCCFKTVVACLNVLTLVTCFMSAYAISLLLIENNPVVLNYAIVL